jgi:hypothetical protein
MMKTEIEAALTSGVSTRQGTVLAGVSLQMLMELRQLGYVGNNGGLTRKGSIKAEALRDAALEAAFG